MKCKKLTVADAAAFDKESPVIALLELSSANDVQANGTLPVMMINRIIRLITTPRCQGRRILEGSS